MSHKTYEYIWILKDIYKYITKGDWILPWISHCVSPKSLSNSEKKKKCINYDSEQLQTLVLPNSVGPFFIHMKLQLLTQFPTPND